jgi:hypothetical protein
MSRVKPIKHSGYYSVYIAYVYKVLTHFKTSQPHYGPGVDSASNKNEYQESSWG